MKRILVISSPREEHVWRHAFPESSELSVQEICWDRFGRGLAQPSGLCLLVAVIERSTLNPAESLRLAAATAPYCPCLVVLPEAASPQQIEAASRFASDFVLQPLRPGELRSRVGRLLTEANDGVTRSRQHLAEEKCFGEFVTQDAKFLRVLDDVCKLARANAPVLIVGETGTGKELCARALHHLSSRRHGPFIPVDCAALPDHLFENELFGHVRGSFTDAHRDQKGLVALANGGTLFLDEVDGLTLAAQGKLLRFLQDRVYRPLGSERFLAAEVTVLAATNRDIRQCVEERQFRSDLYFRLNVLNVTLSPLRERPGDIELLARHYINRFVNPGEPAPVLTVDAAERLRSYDWPGNVRELINVMQRAVALAEKGRIEESHLALGVPLAGNGPGRETTFREARAQALERFERKYIKDLLEEHHGNVTHAARAARKERRSFGRMMKKYGIDRAAS
jgi:two-component system response regulator GlrR